jgi:hypothetical protein
MNWEAIRQANPIADTIGQAIPLKKSGREYKACCPFHDERTPSFHVIPDKDFAHCFGCGWSGDVVDFVRDYKKVSTNEAVALLKGAGDFSEPAQKKEVLSQRNEAEALRRSIAVREAQSVWQGGSIADPHHPYLVRKGVPPHMARQHSDGRLMLPILDATGEVQSVQFIADDGTKRFLPGAPTASGRAYIGINMGRTIICEGFATGASIYDVMPDQVCVAYSLNNMETLARELHAEGRSIVLASDQGTAAARMRSLGAELDVPVIYPRESDFNDDAKIHGPEIVAATFRDGLKEYAEDKALAKPSLPFVWFSDARPNLEANDFVEGMLTSGSMSVIYGPSNCGKTFFVIDMALHVAWGQQWRGRIVDKGAVVYLSLEGAQGVQNRMNAFALHHNCGPLPFVAMPKPVNLLNDDADVQSVIDLVAYIAAKTGLPVRMVIVDTLSRAMAGGNENSSEDMTALIGNCDKIRDATGAHLCIVHHSGKDEARGARGHSSLRAATDTEIEIKRDPEVTRSVVRVAKQRDLEACDPFAFTLKAVTLGENKRGKPVTSCVVLEPDETVELSRSEALSKQEQAAFDAFLELAKSEETDPETGEISVVTKPVLQGAWKAHLVTKETIKGNNEASLKSQFYRLRNSLKSKKKVVQNGQQIILGVTVGNNEVTE